MCQLSHVCCGEQVAQAAHIALTRYSWRSRLRNGCKQRQEQLSAAWAWHHRWRNFAGGHPLDALLSWLVSVGRRGLLAQPFFSPSLEQPFASLMIKVGQGSRRDSPSLFGGWGEPSSPTSVTYLTGKRRYCAKMRYKSLKLPQAINNIL